MVAWVHYYIIKWNLQSTKLIPFGVQYMQAMSEFLFMSSLFLINGFVMVQNHCLVDQSIQRWLLWRLLPYQWFFFPISFFSHFTSLMASPFVKDPIDILGGPKTVYYHKGFSWNNDANINWHAKNNTPKQSINVKVQCVPSDVVAELQLAEYPFLYRCVRVPTVAIKCHKNSKSPI